MTRPDVSIVVPSRAGAQRLPVLLRALRRQTVASWEVIVVLDGDIDGSEEVLAGYPDLPLRTIVFPENRGRVSALNAGFEAARGRILARCDDDLEPGPRYIARLMARHRRGPVGVVGLYRNTFPESAYARIYGRPSDALFRAEAYRSDPSMTWRYWAGNVSVSRETYEVVGPYHPDYRAYGWEDVDWGFRLHQAGIPVVLAPELETPHHAAAQSSAVRVKRAFHSGAARRTFEAKHGVGHLPPAVPTDHSPWNTLVRDLARLDREPMLRVADSLDSRLARLPVPLARKLVSLVVEAAAVSGHRHARQARADF